MTPDELGGSLGARATVVELSSTFCQPCRMARVVLQRAVGTTDGVRLVELDVAGPLGERLGRRLDVLSTPTTLVLDADGVVRFLAAGVPRLAQVRAALESVGATSAGPTSVA
ncbi:thioredoxin family protein [Cellulomonas palmilytica]|nr:thioredoxin family protein [Cellulomonas palmilytica]